MSIYVLPHEQYKLYKTISEAISMGQQSVGIPAFDGNIVLEIYNKVLSENPKGIEYKVGSIRTVTTFLGSTLHLNKNENIDLEKLIFERNKILVLAQKKNNYYDAILAVYRYFVEVFQYADHDNEVFHQIGSPLQYYKAVCEGFSMLFAEILNMMHIPCGVVSGMSDRNGKREPHSWNIVKYKNYYYHLDVTWDICTQDASNGALDYFMLDDNLIKKDHSWNDLSIPKCLDTNEEYYEQHKMVCRSQKEIVNYLSKKLKNGDSDICYRFIDNTGLTTMNEEIVSNIIDKTFRACKVNYSQITYRINNTSGTVAIHVKR